MGEERTGHGHRSGFVHFFSTEFLFIFNSYFMGQQENKCAAYILEICNVYKGNTIAYIY